MKKTLVIVSALALGTSLVLAQSPGPGGQGQGGQGGRGGFGRQQGMRGGGGGIRIVTRPDVQKELNLTDQQKTAIQEKIPAMGGGRRNGGGGAPGGGAAAGAPPGTAGGGAGANGGLPPQGSQGGQGGRNGFGNNAEAQAKLDADIKAILSETQYKRLHELMLQFDGPRALTRADVAKQFDLTEEQKTKIQGIQQTQMQNMRDRMQGGGGGGGDRQAMMQEMQKMQEETSKQILAVLTAEQLKKWNDAQGKAFKFEGRG